MNKDITLRELMAMLPKTDKERRPGKVQLQEEGTVVAAYENADFKMSVYANGYVLALAGKRWTVFGADECEDYSYEVDDSLDPEIVEAQKKTFEIEEFLDLPWTVRLTMTACDRLESNNDEREGQLIAKHKEVTPTPRWLWGRTPSVEDEFIQKEQIRELMSLLTAKQREAVGLWMEGYTQQEMAELLSISIYSLKDRFYGAIKKLKKSF